jgi:hypothetical protein
MCVGGPNFGQVGWFLERGCSLGSSFFTRSPAAPVFAMRDHPLTRSEVFARSGTCAACLEDDHAACEAGGRSTKLCLCCRPF